MLEVVRSGGVWQIQKTGTADLTAVGHDYPRLSSELPQADCAAGSAAVGQQVSVAGGSVLDLQMPGMDGVETALQIGRIGGARGRTVPIPSPSSRTTCVPRPSAPSSWGRCTSSASATSTGPQTWTDPHLPSSGRSGACPAPPVEDLLDLATLDAGQPLSMKFGCHDLAELTLEILELLEPIARSTELRAECVAALDVHCDRERVQQVLANLIGNAIEFPCGAAGGSIDVDRLSGERRGGRVGARTPASAPAR